MGRVSQDKSTCDLKQSRAQFGHVTSVRMRAQGLVLLGCTLLINYKVGAHKEVKSDTGDKKEVLVTLPGLGQLKGKRGQARDKSKKFFKFLGVPFAAPPVGEYRFRPPGEVKPWEGVKEAVKPASACLQNPYFQPTKVVGSEDCLYLNVFTRSLDPEAKKPVIVYIHGGAFIFGSSTKLGGEYFMEEDVVLVTIQYRLNVFGFLSTEDKVSPGNYGLHDQLAALRWVQANIKQFGGDPGKVTVMGMSAGGASVHYLLLSPNSDGLFHRAVSLSGSALCHWANLPKQIQTTRKFARNLNCPVDSSEALVSCLREKSGEELMSGQASLYSWHQGKLEREPMNVWSPRPDKEAGDTAVLAIDPSLAMEVGQIQPVPFLAGIAEHEGIWRANNYLAQDEVMLEMVKNFNSIAPHALGLVNEVPEGKMEDVVMKIKQKYVDATKLTDGEAKFKKIVTGMIAMFGDAQFNYPVDRMVKLHGNKDYAPVWMMTFSYAHNHSLAYFDPANPTEVMFPAIKELHEASHGAHLGMMFPAFVKEFGKLSDLETKVSRKFVDLLVSFADKGVPNEFQKRFKTWKPIMNGKLNHLDTGKYFGVNKGLPFQERMKFWHELPVFWNKNKAKSETEKKVEEKIDLKEDFQEEAVDEIIAEDEEIQPEELSPGELEEVKLAEAIEIMKAAGQLKDEL